jgi:hypothetical protein
VSDYYQRFSVELAGGTIRGVIPRFLNLWHYGTRFMLRLDKTSQPKPQQLITQFGTPQAHIIRQLIVQATPEGFSKELADEGSRALHATDAVADEAQSEDHAMICR